MYDAIKNVEYHKNINSILFHIHTTAPIDWEEKDYIEIKKIYDNYT